MRQHYIFIFLFKYRGRDTDQERKRSVYFYNGSQDIEFKKETFSKRGGKSAPNRIELHDGVLKWLQQNDPYYLKNELQKLFDEKGWIIIYTPPGMPQWQPIENVWAIAKGHVRRKYRHSEQNYKKMKKDLVHGFYGDKSTGYKGVTPSRVKQLIKSCENSMLDWINKNTKANITDFKILWRRRNK